MLKRLSNQLSGKAFSQTAIVLIIFLLALTSRLWHLWDVPPSMIHDELNYVMSAKSIFHTGKVIPQTASSLFSFSEKDYDVVISEIPQYLIALFIGPFRLNQFTARLPYAVVSSFSVVLLYLVAGRLLGRRIGIICGVVGAFNPWSIHLGRTALEVNFATLFYLAGFYFVLLGGWKKIIYALIFFILMFFSYLGAKLHFLTLVMIFGTFVLFTRKSDKRIAIFFIFLAVSFFFLYFLTLRFQPAGSRTDELIVFNNQWASSIVNDERRLSFDNKATFIFSNKLTAVLRRIFVTYLNGFSTGALFSRGETVSVYSLWEYGQFHYLDFFLALLGFATLFSKRKKAFWLLFALLIIGPLVSAIDLVENTYAIRAFPMFPVLVMLISAGADFVFRLPKYGKTIFFFLATAYFLGVFYFFYVYFFRYPLYSAERWYFSERLAIRYANLVKDRDDIDRIIISTVESPKIVFENYLFYSGLYDTKSEIDLANKIIKSKDYTYGKVSVIHGCPTDSAITSRTVLISHERFGCVGDAKLKSQILDVKDSGTVFVIENDKLCLGYQLPKYYYIHRIEDMHIEDLDVEHFCGSWIARFN